MFTIEKKSKKFPDTRYYILFCSKKLSAKYNSRKTIYIMVFANCINLSSQYKFIGKQIE